jgi:glycosyltransferase involved in cell wall biosynthesis
MIDSFMPLVSVVIPCFNQAHFLNEAIESVRGQVYPRLEVIVVDDGSADNTLEVAGRYPDVRRFRQRNLGVAAARNLGFAESRGTFVVFLDADDRLLHHAIQVGVEALAKRPPVAFAAGMSRDIGEDGRVIRERRQPLVTQDHYLRLLGDCYIWSGSSVVYKRTAIEAVGGFNETLDAGDDYELYLNIARHRPIFCHDTVVTEYRRHGSNTTRDAALVLRSELRVLHGQGANLTSKRDRAARRAGMRSVRSEHGRALAEQAALAWSAGRRREALRGIRALAHRSPLNLGRFAKQVSGSRGFGVKPLAMGAER